MAENQDGDTEILPSSDTMMNAKVIASTECTRENGIMQESKNSDVISESSNSSSNITESTPISMSSESETEENQSFGLYRPWGFSSYDDYDVITVHGLRDDYSTAWKLNKRESWLRPLLSEDISIRQLDFVYAIDSSARIFQRGGIKAEAQDLLREYCKKRQELPDTEIARPIVWACHDIGGSIVKEVLIEATRATNLEDYADVETWKHMKDSKRGVATLSTAIIFLGCPHRPRPLDTLEEEIHNLMMLPGPELNPDLLKKVKSIAYQVNKINSDFLETNFFSRIINTNVFHQTNSDVQANEKRASSDTVTPTLDTDYTVGEIDDHYTAFDEISREVIRASQPAIDPSTIKIGNPGVPFSRYTLTLCSMFELNSRFVEDIDHLGLVKDERLLRGLWADNRSKLSTHRHYSLRISADLIHGQIALLSMMPPRKMPRAHSFGDVKGKKELPVIGWISNQTLLKSFNETHGPQVLHIECPAGAQSRTSLLSQYFYNMYEVINEAIFEDGSRGGFYFEFDRFDTRYNTIKSMLITFISQIAWRFWHKPKDSLAIRRVFESLNFYRCWSLADLFKLFTDVRKCPSVDKFTLILSCWDNCDQEERTWFLSRILEQHRRSDLNHRLVITTTGPDDFLKQSMPSSQVLFLENCPVSIQGYALDEKDPPSGLGPLLEDLLQRRPSLKNIQATLVQLMNECQEMPCLGYIILNWLARFGRRLLTSNLATAIEQLRPVTPDRILATIIEKLSPKKQKLARVIYRWVKYTMEPLTIEALGHAVAASMPLDYPSVLDFDYESLSEKLNVLFCGIIILENREVKFSHESFYNCPVLSELGDGNSCEQPAYDHGELAKICLSYLLREEVLQTRYSKFSVDNHGGGFDKCLLLLPRDDLFDYAVRLWNTHYQLSDQCRPVNLALQFFQNKQARSKWAEAHYLLSNPFTRIHRSYFSPLPMMAALGLEDVISRQIEEEKDSEWFQKDCWLAITEAGRNGHISVLRRLLNQVQVQESGLQDAIYWSTFSGNEKIITELLDKVSSLNNFSFPSSTLYLASAAGLENLVSAILKRTNHSLNEPNPETGNQTALHTAVYWGHKTIVELLLNSGASTGTQDGEGETPLLLSIRMGDPEVIQLFLEKDKATCHDQKSGPSLINAAITAGELMALKCILLAGADCKAGEFEASSNELRYPIIHAAANGRTECIRLLLDNGADACTESKYGSVLYILSANFQAFDSCRILLEKGALHHQCYPDKEMLLSRALRANNRRLAALLIDKGVKLDIADTYGGAAQRTPLSYAVTMCSAETLKFLLNKGANPNYVPEGTNSPLYTAASRCTDNTKVEFLLKHGADVHWKRDDGWGPLHAACAVPSIVSLLLDHGSDINAMTDSGTALMTAARWNCPDTLSVLLSRKSPSADLNAIFHWDGEEINNGKTALDLAIHYHNYECANLLIEAGAQFDVDSVTIEYIIETVVDERSEDEAFKMLNHCLQRGMKIDGTDRINKTALHYITKDTPVSLIRFLIDWGCQVDALDWDGLTPLAVAVRCGNIAAAEYLLSRGARADGADDGVPSFGSILRLALGDSSRDPGDIIEMMKVLIKDGADPLQCGLGPAQESLLHIVARDFRYPSSRKLCRYLIREVGLNVSTKSGQGEYPIIIAASRQEWALVKYLIRHNADCNVADSQGRHIGHYIAALNSDEEFVKFVSKSGTDMQVPDDFGRSPLHLAAGYGYRHAMGAIISTLPKETNVDIRDSDGWTPLMWACRSDSLSWAVVDDLVTKYNADISVTSTDGQWSPLKLAHFSDMDADTKKLLKPLKECGDGNSQYPGASLRHELPGVFHEGWYCDSCLMASRGQRYKCMACRISFDLCFKCYPHRSKMHDAGHNFEEYREDPSIDENKSDSKASNAVSGLETDDEDGNLEEGDGDDANDDDENYNEDEGDDADDDGDDNSEDEDGDSV